MDPAQVQLVQQSFGRCLLNTTLGPSFLDAFYEVFLASDPRVKLLFARTDMGKQKELLRQGLVMLIMYGKGSGLAQSAVKQLAVKHDREHLNIKPELYRVWVRSLLSCVQKYDQKFDDSLDKLWNEILDHGIRAMKDAY